METKTIFYHSEILVNECRIATGFLTRFKGLMGKRSLDIEQSLFFPKCNSIHMWFMKIPIEVIFLKSIDNLSELEIVSLVRNVQPWSLFPIYDFKAEHVLEVPVGTIDKYELIEGERLCLN
ncbi:MAG: hypothetical protein CL678_10160 [Bdellovibrionaceae bacterium]|nr:hypothetical protein [Pseudobdellovibrionaceae bacterium]|tara:strand:- start:10138 stop:10500 length:363 start_codon:yes stop_codon:yes gene_type:complete